MPKDFDLSGFNEYQKEYRRLNPHKAIIGQMICTRNKLVKYGLSINANGDFCKDGKPLTRKQVEAIVIADCGKAN